MGKEGRQAVDGPEGLGVGAVEAPSAVGLPGQGARSGWEWGVRGAELAAEGQRTGDSDLRQLPGGICVSGAARARCPPLVQARVFCA
jgi:hypothetical protein